MFSRTNDSEVAEIFNNTIAQHQKEYCKDELAILFDKVCQLIVNLQTKTTLTGYKRKAAIRALVEYTIGEYEFYREGALVFKDSIPEQELVLKIANKYVAQRLAEENGAFTKGMKPFNHLVSTLSTTTMILESVNEPLSRHDPNFSLMNDLFETTFKKISGFTKMLALGLYLDSYVSWRTIHESESTLSLLVHNDDKAKDSYVKHIVYSNMYYNPEEFDDKLRDSIFENQIKVEMANHGLKSKDMKKFLEYGWLFDCKEYDMEKHPKFKLNFNDGVDELAGLREKYNEFYRGTSEIAHSSSIFFYANEEGIKKVSIMLTYESCYHIFSLYREFMNEYFVRHPNEMDIVDKSIDDVKKIAVYLRSEYEKE